MAQDTAQQSRTENRPDGDERGRSAESPGDIPAKGWKDIAKRVKDELKRDQVPLLSAGVAFYALLASVPALAAFVSIYALVADPQQVQDQVTNLTEALPEDASQLIESQLTNIVEGAGGGVGFAALIGIAGALWSASSGMKHLIEAINAAYDEEEGRGFVALRGLALALTLGAMLFALVALGVIVVLPAALGQTGLGAVGSFLARWVPYLLLAVGFGAGLAVLYRYAPDRDDPQWNWATPGALVATAVWVIGSVLFTIYVGNFGSYNETYGSLGAVIVLMLWMVLTAFAIILGAEVDSEMEAQTAKDTTKGEPQPMGDRDAVKADNVGHTEG